MQNNRIIDRLQSFLSHYLSSVAVLAIDWFLSMAASVITCLVANSLLDGHAGWHFCIMWLATSLVASPVLYVLMGTYRIIIRHTSFADVFRFGMASAIKALLLLLASMIYVRLRDPQMALSGLMLVSLCDFLLTLVFIVGIRAVMIMAYHAILLRVRPHQRLNRILVYGTSDKSTAMLTRLEHSSHYNIIGFVSSDESSKNLKISSYKVYTINTISQLERLRDKLDVSAILFPTEEDLKTEGNAIVAYANICGIKALIAPGIDEYSDHAGGANPRSLVREVRIEDLLCREEIKISLDAIKKNFRGKTVMVTGAAGSIGSELCRQLVRLGVEKLILFDNAETPMHNLRLEFDDCFPALDYVPVIGDVRNEERLEYAFSRWKPQVVFHAAAYKHVPLMEDNPCEAVAVNVGGSHHVADACVRHGVEMMVMISTDKAVNPTNIMGCTKRLAEIYVQSLGLGIASGKVEGHTKFVTTRFGNVLGSNGSVIPRFRQQIEKGGPVTVTHPDINRFFMTIPEACRLVMEAATISTGNQIVVFDMGKPVKIDTLARRMIGLAGFVPDKDIKIEYTGLRPGEKLYEEVLSNVENTEPTSHDRIRVAKVREYDYSDALEAVDKLEQLAAAVDIPEMVKYMKSVVPEFISKNSPYEIYDRRLK